MLDFEDGFEYARRTRLGFSVSELLASHLIRNAKGLRVVERKQLDKVLSELELRLSGFLTEPEAARLGDLVGADLLLLGSVSEAGEDVVIVTRLVETDTGAALLSESISVPRSVLIPEARKSIQVDNRAAGGYRLTYSDGFWEHEAALSYQYKFLKGLALGFEVSGGISSADVIGRLFPTVELAKSIYWEDVPAAQDGTVVFTDTVRLSGLGAWIGAAYRF